MIIQPFSWYNITWNMGFNSNKWFPISLKMSFLRQKRIIRKIYWKQSTLNLLGALWNSCLLFYQTYSVEILFTHHFYIYIYISLVPDFILKHNYITCASLWSLWPDFDDLSYEWSESTLNLSSMFCKHREIRPCLSDLKAVSQYETTASEKYTRNTNILLLSIMKLYMEWIKNKWIQVFNNIKNNY